MKYTNLIAALVVVTLTTTGAQAQRFRQIVPAPAVVPQTNNADASPVPSAPAAPATKGVPTFPGTNDQWKDSQDTDWIAKERASHVLAPHYNNRAVLKGDQRDGHAYGRYTEKDLLLWQEETERLALEGSRIFHSADLLGSPNGTSCDMCHPDAANTHPETYPKYQVQLGRAALLRDMINWCLQHPCRAEPMSGDDPRMRALEAYIQAQASGKVMKYGKH
ncbi:MAG: hypothetical protein Q4D98_11185 [Planctomycetia bacterium]|nr:hypothetical protein [Planctomycetia bacterium]